MTLHCGFLDQVRHKLVCAASVVCYCLKTLDIETRGILLLEKHMSRVVVRQRNVAY